MLARTRLLTAGRRWAPRLLGAALFAWALTAVGPVQVWRGLAGADPWLILPALVVAPPFVGVKGWRWARIGAGLGIPLPGGEAFRLYAIGLWAALVTPGQAGDFLKVWYLRARGVALAPALLSCFLDRLFDLAALFGLGALALFAFAPRGPALLPVVVALATVCAALALALGARWRAPVLACWWRWAPRALRERLARDEGLRSLARARLDRGGLLPVLALTALAWAVSLGRVYLCFRAVGVRLAAIEFLGVAVLATLAGLVSISGIGTRDVALLALLVPYGYDGGQALAISFLILALNISNTVPGFVLWLRDPLPLPRRVDEGPTGGRPEPVVLGE